jgi:hypothetical protein
MLKPYGTHQPLSHIYSKQVMDSDTAAEKQDQGNRSESITGYLLLGFALGYHIITVLGHHFFHVILIYLRQQQSCFFVPFIYAIPSN